MGLFSMSLLSCGIVDIKRESHIFIAVALKSTAIIIFEKYDFIFSLLLKSVVSDKKVIAKD